jgi:ferritin-like metal-binding protein YciE
MALETLRDLLEHSLLDLLCAETRAQGALSRMAQVASTPALKQAFGQLHTETATQIERLEQCLTALGLAARDMPCKGMEGLLAEAGEMMDQTGPDPVVDAGLIGSAQRIEHYEVAAYRSAISYAVLLGEEKLVTLLRQSLREEQAADATLTRLATGEVNEIALAAGTRITES